MSAFFKVLLWLSLAFFIPLWSVFTAFSDVDPDFGLILLFCVAPISFLSAMLWIWIGMNRNSQ